jgi:BMFP domain-containing protein YqiC
MEAAMESRNKVLDDLSKLMTNAMGVAQGAREEAETAIRSAIDRWLADRDFVTREEFDAVRAMAQKAREETPRWRPGYRRWKPPRRRCRKRVRRPACCQICGATGHTNGH